MKLKRFALIEDHLENFHLEIAEHNFEMGAPLFFKKKMDTKFFRLRLVFVRNRITSVVGGNFIAQKNPDF
jgi:hypothetical protein